MSRFFQVPEADKQRIRQAHAEGIHEARRLLRSGSRTLDVMRKSWSQELLGSPVARAVAAGMQDAVAHRIKMDARNLTPQLEDK